MAVQVHLHISSNTPDSESLVSWLRLQDGKPSGGIKQGTLTQAAKDIGHDPLWVYVPSGDILLTRISLPAGRRSQLLTALPYVLEDHVLDDISSLHCALGYREQQQLYSVGVINRERLQSWLDWLATAGLMPRRLQPDLFLLPLQNNSWSLLCQEDHALLRYGPSAGFACPLESLKTLLPKLLEERRENPPAHIDLWHCNEEQQQFLAEINSSETDIEWRSHELPPAADSGLNLLRQYGTDNGRAINLLQGSYAPGSRVKQYLKPWITAAALLLAWFVLGLVSDISEYYSLKKQNHQLQQQITGIFKKTFPEVKRIVNPQSQMKSRLRKLSGGSATSSTPFSEMLARVSPITAKVDKLVIHHLKYNPGKLELTLELPSMQSIESLKEQIASETPYEVEIKSANAGEKNVEGRLIIRGQS